MIKRLAVAGLLATSSTLCCLGSASAKVHTIRPGDTLSAIARLHHVSVKDLAHLNGLTDKSLLSLGKKLNVPDSSSRNHAPSKGANTPPSQAIAIGIIAKTAPFRAEPTVTGKKLGEAVAGAQVKILQTKWHWHQVKTKSGKIGWVGDYLVHTRPIAQPKQVVAKASPARTTHSARVKTSKPVYKKYAANRGSSAYKAKASSKVKRVSDELVVAANTDADSPSESSAVKAALNMRGARYRFGGTSSRGGFDCSGFTRWVYAKQGVSLPHNAAAQSGRGAKVSKGELKPGDLVFFQTRGRRVGHVGVYTGNGKFVHASNPRGGVKVDSINSGYYGKRFVGARRVK